LNAWGEEGIESSVFESMAGMRRSRFRSKVDREESSELWSETRLAGSFESLTIHPEHWLVHFKRSRMG